MVLSKRIGLRALSVLSLFVFSPSHSDDVASVFSRAFDFLEQHNRVADVSELRSRALDEYLDRWDLVEVLLEQAVRKQSRPELVEVIQLAWRNNRCTLPTLSGPARELCDRVRKRWTDNLDSLFMLESSAGNFEKARRLVEAGNCAEGLELLGSLRAAEGTPKPLLKLMSRAYSCVGNEAGLTEVELALRELNLETTPR